jgi:dihydroflavonol-4-reductase
MAEVLVTGSTGLIGANLTRELLAAGHRVRALVRPESDLRPLHGLPIERFTGDVLQPASLEAAMTGCDWLFHAATPFSYQPEASARQSEVAIDGLRHTLEEGHRAGIKRLILTSSSVVCGSSTRLQVRHEQDTLEDPDPPHYISAKAQQEDVARQMAASLNLDLVVVCPALCVGPHDYRLGPSNGALVQYLNDPFRSTFPGGANLVSALDVAIGHRLVAERGQAGERYLLGAENLEWSMIHRVIAELCGLSGPHLYANHTLSFLNAISQELMSAWWRIPASLTREHTKMIGRYYWYSSEKAASLGYRPRSSRQAMAEALAWLLTSPHITEGIKATLHPETGVVEAQRKHRQEGSGFATSSDNPQSETEPQDNGGGDAI